ncbi:FMN reductase [Xanthomonas hortorum pv. vitians]|uniref:FMN reductase n=2 Tax=Xanthomonas hortorum TaxID=56454 RepID=A0A6V7CTA2_9XANT|nr:FMN reductase [Xanthomonas hortorum]MCC4623651.1 FMN reductase [Xanthomonas campestris pv. nigromaculans]APP79563.1 FMN reductase [Xanthomonas hortorum pv. gardneri]ASW46437.1 FMN reductase [Xanthomonas hortorum]EGD18197.1 putative flavoprotein [Xanthomonas hortorum ATCC 19865]KLA96579.1 FMN reductase [Xanthomonas hortorum pv. gardneri]
MRTPLNVVAVSGGTSRPSRSLALAEATLAELARRLPIKPSILQLGDIARPLGAALWRSELDETTEQALRQIESADLLLVVAPVYRGSYPGLLKHLFDLIDINALIDTPILLAATGGSERHALVIDHQLRPLFAFFQALTLPIGIYATETDFQEYRVVNPALRQRIELAAERAAGVLGARADALRRIA